jgi:predicted nucleotidyltransferase
VDNKSNGSAAEFIIMQKNKHSLKPAQKDNLVATISSYLEQNCKKIVAAYLFGSFVSQRLFSDIDLGILIAGDSIEALDFELDLENRLEKIVKYSVDVRVLNRAPLSFCRNVIRHRKVILDRDPNLRAYFEGQILKQYFDVAYFQRQYLQEVGDAPL